MSHVTAIKIRLFSALAVLGLTSSCGDIPSQKSPASTKLTPSAQKKLEKNFNVTRPGATTMRIGTQEGGGEV